MTSVASRGESRHSPLLSRFLSGPLAHILRRLGILPTTEEEFKVLLKEGLAAGVFEEAEHMIVERVFRLGDHRASELMTPMNEVVWLDVADSPDAMKQKIMESIHSRFPVCEGSIDNILGIVQVKDLLIQGFTGQPFGLKGLLKMPLLIYEGTPGLKVLEMFKKTGIHVAVVLDEYGSVRGLLTLNDIMEAIVGDLPVGDVPEPPGAVRRDDGSWLMDGTLGLDELRDLLTIDTLPEGDYQTLAGFVINRGGQIPAAGDWLDWGDYRFEVVEMDGHRVDKVLVGPRRGP